MVSNEEILAFLKSTNEENKKKNEEIKQEISDLKLILSNEIRRANEVIEKISLENESFKQKVLKLERKSKKFNLVVYGLASEESNPASDIIGLCNHTLGITCDRKDFRDVYDIGKNTDKPRPILVELLYYEEKIEILKKGHLLKGSGIYVDNDYPKEDYEKRKFLKSQLKLAKEKNYTAKIKNNTLIIGGQTYTYEELKAETERADQEQPEKDNDINEDNLEETNQTIQNKKEEKTSQSSGSTKERDLEDASPDKEKPAAKRALSRNRQKNK